MALLVIYFVFNIVFFGGNQVEEEPVKVKPDKFKHHYKIEYVDNDGVITERSIWTSSIIHRNGDRLVNAWCDLRNDKRSFYEDRIKTLEKIN